HVQVLAITIYRVRLRKIRRDEKMSPLFMKSWKPWVPQSSSVQKQRKPDRKMRKLRNLHSPSSLPYVPHLSCDHSNYQTSSTLSLPPWFPSSLGSSAPVSN